MVSLDDHERLQEIFLNALEKPEGPERAGYLETACSGDANLLGQVELLLKAHHAAGSFMEAASAKPGSNDLTSTSKNHANSHRMDHGFFEPGMPIGARYILKQKIGEGGMGEVWVATQTEPVKRSVAIKLIRPGMDCKKVLARFDAERQALAMMDHPHICKVFDGGMTERGQPYFVMELVDGKTMNLFCDEAKLTTQQRLKLFLPICQAVQHAHQKGIIHRDLKPANILITMIDGTPVPKVIDFGVAKSTDVPISDESLSHGFGLIGTLEYMSPEQVGFDGIDIDTRSDIFSLGVVLYELLTGLKPIDRKRIKRAVYGEVIRIIQEEEPSKPSTRISTAESLPSIAANRQTEPYKLKAILRGELDCVVLKCLEKQRDRRYSTALDLARDIERYLADQPVEARPPSAGYLLGKFLRRHRGPVISIGLLLLTLIGGIVGTTFWLLEARKQAKIAQDETLAKDAALQVAQSANEQTYLALKSFTDELMENLLGGRQKLTESEKAILRSAQKQWEIYAQSQGDTPEARLIRSDGAAQLSQIQFKLGLFQEGESNQRKALEIREGLVRDFPEVAKYREKLAMIHNSLGSTLRNNHNRAEAETHHQIAVDQFGKLSADFPDEPAYPSNMAKSLISLANSKRDRKAMDQAEKHYRDALATLNRCSSDHPKAFPYQDDIGRAHWGLAFTLKHIGRFPEAEVEYRDAIAIMEKLAAANPGQTQFRQFIALLSRELGVMLYDTGKLEEGAKLFPKAIDTLGQLAADFPSFHKYQFDICQCRRDYGKVLGMLKKQDQGEEQFREAIKLEEKLVSDNPTVLLYLSDLGLTYSYYADLVRDGKKPENCLALYEKGIQALQGALSKDPQLGFTRTALHRSHKEYARAFIKLSRYKEAIGEWEKAIEISAPDTPSEYPGMRAYCMARTGQMETAFAVMKALAQKTPDDPMVWYQLACIHALASEKAIPLKGPKSKEDFANLAMENLIEAAKRGFANPKALEADPDFRTLADRDDFSKLVETLKLKHPKEN